MKPIDGGTKRLTRRQASGDEWPAVLEDMVSRAPPGFAFWRAKAQRSVHGRRVSLTVVFASLEWIEAGARERQERRR